MSRFLNKEDPQDKALKEHIKSLGLSTTKEYQKWCQTNGFGSGLFKNDNLRQKEKAKVKEIQLLEVMDKNKNRLKPLDQKIQKALKNKNPKEIIDQDPQLKFLFSEIPTMEQINLEEFLELLAFLSKKSKLTKDAEFFRAFWKIFKHRNTWIRPFSSWEANSKNTHRQFSSFIRHLFTKYKMPDFLDSVWFDPNRMDTLPIKAFLWIASGQNIRKLPDLPLELTKKMSHEFLNSPSSYNFYQALRYGQIIGMGGDTRLAQAINETFLGRDFKMASSTMDFWNSVIHFFILHPMLDRHQVGPIIDYLQSQKFGANAPQPGLSMKGRDPTLLLEHVEAWHKQLQRIRGKNYREWPSSGISEFSKEEKSGEITKEWIVMEMKNSKELDTDSRTLKHCVSSYAQSCINKRCAIYSLRLDGQRLGTIEVIPASKIIVQARGRFNALLTGKNWMIIQEWAAKAGLKIQCSGG